MKRQYNQGSYSLDPRYLHLKSNEYNQEKSINSLKQEKADVIAKRIAELQNYAELYKNNDPDKNKKYLFRFNNGPEGLQSIAQKNNQEDLPEEIRKYFIQQHMHKNQKTVKEDNQTYYSPFLSTTENLKDFVTAAFSPQGDINVRHDVLHRAPKIGLFGVPKEYTISPQSKVNANPDSIDLPTLEKEVLWDSTKGGNLKNYYEDQFSNPLLNQMGVDLTHLYGARGFDNPSTIYPPFYPAAFSSNSPYKYTGFDEYNMPLTKVGLKDSSQQTMQALEKLPRNRVLNTEDSQKFEDLQKRAEELQKLMFLYNPKQVIQEYNPNLVSSSNMNVNNNQSFPSLPPTYQKATPINKFLNIK